MSRVTQLLRANRIFVNRAKVEIVIIWSQWKSSTKKLNLRVNDQKVDSKKQTKYVGVWLDKHLAFKAHIEAIKWKLTIASGILAKLGHYVSRKTFRSIYYALFDSNLRYACQIWGQNANTYIEKM